LTAGRLAADGWFGRVRRGICTILVPLVVLAVMAAGPAGAQAVDAAAKSRWERVLGAVEVYVRSASHNEDDYKAYSNDLAALIQDARAAAAAAKQDIETANQLLNALGPPPAAGEPAEVPEAAQQRRQLNDALAKHKARLGQAEYAITRATALQDQLAELFRADFVAVLLQRWPSPLLPQVAPAALREFADNTVVLARAPFEWYVNLPAEQASQILLHWRTLFFAAALAVGLALRHVALRRFGPDPALATPGYARRFVAAIATALGEGVLPAALLLAMQLRILTHGALISGLPADVLASVCQSLIALTLITAFSSAILRPKLPDWRLTRLTSKAAQRLHRRIVLLGTVFAIDLLFRSAATNISVSDDAKSFYVFFAVSAYALGLVLLTRPSVWQVEAVPTDGPTADGEAVIAPSPAVPVTAWARGWQIARTVIATVAIAGAIAAGIGYSRIGLYLTYNLVISAITLGGLYLLRGLMRETIELLSRRPSSRISSAAPRWLRAGTLHAWGGAIVDPLLVAAGLYLIAPDWGLPREEASRWLGAFLAGFSIGGVTISILDIALALGVFSAALVLTRLGRQALAESILPRTSLDPGVRNSIAVGVGYLGFVAAVLLAAGVLGLGMSNLAIVAGALSVGIGFGLQNIVNNFVSGLILLVERPLQVGDWVVIGDKQGHVKRINVRATEIETFERASVIVPNSEVLSSALINWTHKNTLGRVDVRVGAAYGTDTRKIRELLLACAQAHPEVMEWPKPFVIFADFAASSLDFVLYAYLRNVDKRMSVASDLRFAIDDAFRANGIEIPYAQQVLHFAPGEVPRPFAAMAVANPPAAQPPEPGTEAVSPPSAPTADPLSVAVPAGSSGGHRRPAPATPAG
jgi:small-conductance mechanosensitive channel